jgi:hypothetical protein
VTNVCQVAVLFFELGSSFATPPTVAVFLIVVLGFAFTLTVIWTSATTGFFGVQTGSVPIVQLPEVLWQEIVGGEIKHLKVVQSE